MTKTSKRIKSIDIAKGICFLCVIVGHFFQRYELSKPMQLIYCFHMPLLFILSGYFISNKKSINDFIICKARRLLIPYFSSAGIYMAGKIVGGVLKHKDIYNVFKEYLVIILYGGGDGRGTWNILTGNIIYKDEIGMLWFLLALFWGSC